MKQLEKLEEEEFCELRKNKFKEDKKNKFSITIGDKSLYLVHGDITKIDVDAIVNSCNS